jgi:hypothetical protein
LPDFVFVGPSCRDAEVGQYAWHGTAHYTIGAEDFTVLDGDDPPEALIPAILAWEEPVHAHPNTYGIAGYVHQDHRLPGLSTMLLSLMFGQQPHTYEPLGSYFAGDNADRRPFQHHRSFNRFMAEHGRAGEMFTMHWHVPASPVEPLHAHLDMQDALDDDNDASIHRDHLWVQIRLIADPEGTGDGVAATYGFIAESAGGEDELLAGGAAFN